MNYDIKIYDNTQERETIRQLTYSQMIAVKSVLDRLGARKLGEAFGGGCSYYIKEIQE